MPILKRGSLRLAVPVDDMGAEGTKIDPGSNVRAAAVTPWWRLLAIGAGWLLLGIAPIIGALPGPGGLIVAAIATIVLIRYSRDARRLFVRIKRRYPQMSWPLRRAVDQFRTRLRNRRRR